MKFFLLLIPVFYLVGCSNKSTDSVDLNRGLVGLWPMSEEGGDTVADHSGQGNHLKNEDNPPSFLPDVRDDGAIDSDGTGDYLERMDEDLSEGFPGKEGGETGSFSITAWVWTRSVDYQMIAAKDEAGGRSFNFSVTGGDANIGVQIGREDSMYHFNGMVTVPEDAWSHLAMVYIYIDDGTSMITTYFNGELDSTISDVVGPVNPTATPFRIGGRSYSGQLRSFNGLIDEVRLYNRALTAKEVMESMTD